MNLQPINNTYYLYKDWPQIHSRNGKVGRAYERVYSRNQNAK